MKLFALTAFCLFASITAISQSSALKIGEQLPDVKFGSILNNPSQKIRTADFRGKLLILDFWNIHCKNCIAAMPKMDSLQKMYENKLQVISITYNSSDEVNRLFNRIKITRPDFPFVVGDSVFNLLFPHEGDPLHVWISEQGKVIAITNDYNTNKYTLDEYFGGKMPVLSRRWDHGIDNSHPLISEVNSGILSHTLSYSVLFKSLDEFSASNSIKINDSIIQVINGTLIQLYKVAYKDMLYDFPANLFSMPINDRIIIDTKDSSPFFPPANESDLADWILRYKFCYEQKKSCIPDSIRHSIMRSDLLQCFPYMVKIESRNVEGLALVRNAESNLETSVVRNDEKLLVLKDIEMSALTEKLNSVFAWQNVPVADETGLTGKFTFYLHPKLSDIHQLNNDLKCYGIKLIPKKIIVRFLVIKDK